MEKGAGQSTWRVLPWHDGGSEYLEGTAEELEVVMFDWPSMFLENKWVPPSLESLQKIDFQKRFSTKI
jgi:hypothetical protein